MRGTMAGKTFQTEGQVDYLLHGLIRFIETAEIRRNLHGAFQRHVQLGGNGF